MELTARISLQSMASAQTSLFLWMLIVRARVVHVALHKAAVKPKGIKLHLYAMN